MFILAKFSAITPAISASLSLSLPLIQSLFPSPLLLCLFPFLSSSMSLSLPISFNVYVLCPSGLFPFLSTSMSMFSVLLGSFPSYLLQCLCFLSFWALSFPIYIPLLVCLFPFPSPSVSFLSRLILCIYPFPLLLYLFPPSMSLFSVLQCSVPISFFGPFPVSYSLSLQKNVWLR